MLVDRHLAWCNERNLRPLYILNRQRVLTLIAAELGQPLDTADAPAVAEWYTALAERVEPATRAVYLSHLRMFYEWMILEELRTDDPTARLMRPKLPRMLPRPMADKDLRRAIRRAPDRIRPMLLLAAFMGLRCCEIAGLHVDHLDRTHNTVTVMAGKGGKQRVVPLHPLVAAVPLPERGWLFPHPSEAGQPMFPHNVSHAINRYLRSEGIMSTAHQLRHHFGTNVYRQSRDLRLTQELMGHSSPTTTAGYAAYDGHQAAAVVAALDVPDEAA